MTPLEIATENARLAAKFAVLKKIVSARKECVEFFDQHERNFAAIFSKYGAKKSLFRSAASELRVWVRDLFEADQKKLALAELQKLDEATHF